MRSLNLSSSVAVALGGRNVGRHVDAARFHHHRVDQAVDALDVHRAHERAFELVGQRRLVARVERRQQGQRPRSRSRAGQRSYRAWPRSKGWAISWTWHPGTLRCCQIGDNPLTFRLRLACFAQKSQVEPMLNVAVQMDPIERINIRGDSTFALLLEAQARGHTLTYYTPDRLAQVGGRVFASVQPLTVRDEVGNHFTLGESRRIELSSLDVILLRQDPPFDLAYITTTHLLERIHPKTLRGQRSGACAQRAREGVRHRVSRPDAADADHARPRGDQGVPRRARRHRDEAALRPRRRRGVPRARATTSISARSTTCSP